MLNFNLNLKSPWARLAEIFFSSLTVFPSTGDQVSPEDSQEVLVHPPTVVQVPAPSLLRPVVHLSASIREGVPLQSAGASYRLRRPQEDAGKEITAPWRGINHSQKKTLFDFYSIRHFCLFLLFLQKLSHTKISFKGLWSFINMWFHCAGLLPGTDAAVWTVWPTCPGSQGPVWDEEGRCSPQRHHLRLLQQGTAYASFCHNEARNGNIKLIKWCHINLAAN